MTKKFALFCAFVAFGVNLYAEPSLESRQDSLEKVAEVVVNKLDCPWPLSKACELGKMLSRGLPVMLQNLIGQIYTQTQSDLSGRHEDIQDKTQAALTQLLNQVFESFEKPRGQVDIYTRAVLGDFCSRGLNQRTELESRVGELLLNLSDGFFKNGACLSYMLQGQVKVPMAKSIVAEEFHVVDQVNVDEWFVLGESNIDIDITFANFNHGIEKFSLLRSLPAPQAWNWQGTEDSGNRQAHKVIDETIGKGDLNIFAEVKFTRKGQPAPLVFSYKIGEKMIPLIRIDKITIIAEGLADGAFRLSDFAQNRIFIEAATNFTPSEERRGEVIDWTGRKLLIGMRIDKDNLQAASAGVYLKNFVIDGAVEVDRD